MAARALQDRLAKVLDTDIEVTVQVDDGRRVREITGTLVSFAAPDHDWVRAHVGSRGRPPEFLRTDVRSLRRVGR